MKQTSVQCEADERTADEKSEADAAAGRSEADATAGRSEADACAK